MKRYEIQVMRQDDDGVMTLLDRCYLDAATVEDAARQYADLFVSSGDMKYRLRTPNTDVTTISGDTHEHAG